MAIRKPKQTRKPADFIRSTLKWALASSLPVCVAAPAAVWAQENPPRARVFGLEEVVVTARKREESALDVADSLAVLSGDALARSAITNTFDLQYAVSGLNLSQVTRETNIAIRGINNNVRVLASDPSVATYIDGVYMQRSAMVLTEMYDIERVEVLKGPQGTLYGRNANGGVINVISKQPEDELGVEGFVGAGSRDLVRSHAAVNVPFSGGAVRLSGAYANDDGYTRDIFDEDDLDATDLWSLRGQARFDVSERSTARFSVQYTEDDSSVGYGYSNDDANPEVTQFPMEPDQGGLSPRLIRDDSPDGAFREMLFATFVWQTDFDTIGFRGTAGYSDFSFADAQDTDRSSFPADAQVTSTDSTAFSQELLLFNTNADKLEWTAGLFYFEDEADEFVNFFNASTGQPLSFIVRDAQSESASAFGQATYAISDSFSVLGGVRYNRDERSSEARNQVTGGIGTGDETFNDFTWKGQLIFQPGGGSTTLYAGASTGFKSGGFNVQGSPTLDSFDPESVTLYELGIKAPMAGGGGFVTAAAFYTDYKDIQLRRSIVAPGNITSDTDNGGSADIYGIEGSLSLPIGNVFSVDVNAMYLDTKLHNFINSQGVNLEGSELPLSPQFSGSIGLQFAGDIYRGASLRVRIEAAGQSEVIFPELKRPDLEREDGYVLLNSTIRYTTPSERFYVELLGRNLADKTYKTFVNSFVPRGLIATYGPPRTLEARIGFRL